MNDTRKEKITRWVFTSLTVAYCVVLFVCAATGAIPKGAQNGSWAAACNKFMASIHFPTRFSILSLRKSLHFTVYMLLGIFTFITMRKQGIKPSLLYDSFWVIVIGFAEEVFQMGAPGGEFALTDVFEDLMAGTLGGALALLVVLFIALLKKAEGEDEEEGGLQLTAVLERDLHLEEHAEKSKAPESAAKEPEEQLKR